MIRRFSIGYDVELHKRTVQRGLLSLLGPDAAAVAGVDRLRPSRARAPWRRGRRGRRAGDPHRPRRRPALRRRRHRARCAGAAGRRRGRGRRGGRRVPARRARPPALRRRPRRHGDPPGGRTSTTARSRSPRAATSARRPSRGCSTAASPTASCAGCGCRRRRRPATEISFGGRTVGRLWRASPSRRALRADRAGARPPRGAARLTGRRRSDEVEAVVVELPFER